MLSCAAASMFLGFLNYFLFQSNTAFLSFFHWGSKNIFTIHNNSIRVFLTGYFSDIAWCIALYLIAVVLSEKGLLHLFNKILILLLPFIIEASQYFGWINGTFDWYDLLVYAIILLLFIIFFPTLNPIKNEKG